MGHFLQLADKLDIVEGAGLSVIWAERGRRKGLRSYLFRAHLFCRHIASLWIELRVSLARQELDSGILGCKSYRCEEM